MQARVSIDGFSRFEPIGKGGFAQVYKAWQPDFNRHVAVKVLSLGENRTIDRAQFEAECRAMGAVSSHPNVVTVFDAGFTNEGYPFIAMELCTSSLVERIERSPQRRLGVDEVLEIGARIADALDRAHDKGILHRDLKPQNILFTEYSPVLTDFGIASLGDSSHQTSWALSRHYAAPEVLDDEPYTVACDVYSLGATLYTALAGHRPFSVEGDNDAERVEHRIRFEPPPPLDASEVPTDVEAEIMRMLSKHPGDRHRSARHASDRLGALANRYAAFDSSRAGRAHDDITETRANPDADNYFGASEATDATEGDTTLYRGDERDRRTEDFLEEQRSKRPLVAGLVLALVVAAAVAALLLLRDEGSTPSPAEPTPEPTLEPDVDIPIPSPPRDVTVSVDGTEVTVEWSADPDADVYRVFPSFGESVITQEPQFVFEGVAPDGAVCVEVTTVNEFGRESAKSAPECG